MLASRRSLRAPKPVNQLVTEISVAYREYGPHHKLDSTKFAFSVYQPTWHWIGISNTFLLSAYLMAPGLLSGRSESQREGDFIWASNFTQWSSGIAVEIKTPAQRIRYILIREVKTCDPNTGRRSSQSTGQIENIGTNSTITHRIRGLDAH